MKKLDLFKYVAVFAAFSLLCFVAGCGERDDELVDGGDPNGEIVIPNEPPSASGGNLTKTGGKPVSTQEDLQDFIELFVSALLGYYDNYSSAKRAELPAEYYKGTGGYSGSATLYGNSGRVEMSGSEFWQVEWNSTMEDEEEIETEYDSFTYKFFDFSNHDELFLGGSVGILRKPYQNGRGYTTQANGTINFAGKYQGKVVFDNVTVTAIHDDNWNGMNWDDDYTSDITKGSFYVQSGNGTKFDLPASIVSDFSLNGDDKYPDDKITISMPAVPNVTGGNLQNRGGESVNEENVNAFFSAFVQEFTYSYYYTRAAIEGKEIWEQLEHGRASGYYTEKGDRTWQSDAEGRYGGSATTTKVEYHDYSNNGVLYFGGGFGSAEFGESKENSSGLLETGETIIKGTVKFNGQFEGELVFNNFKYKDEWGRVTDYQNVYTYISGSVKIGDLDVTQKYFEYVIKGNSIPSENKTGSIVGVFEFVECGE
ncbi:MAG: hypothetical protein FWF51_12305 [Chitinivibrionia bacterium]|nr:hypothetical protein [Chitinivibrionia bacterium]